jgi:hypothetical protein
MNVPDDDQTRIFRIVRVPPSIEYGWWRQAGKNRRFETLRCWPVKDLSQTKEALERARMAIFTELDELPGVDAEAIRGRHHIKRDFLSAPADIVGLIDAGRKGLEVPELPTVEESHARLKVDVPAAHGAGRQFYCYLNEEIYRKLVAMSAAAKCTRNRMLEAMILFTGTLEWQKEKDDESWRTDSD